MLTTNQKGAIAETAIAHAALKLGIDAYRPIVEGGRYDLVFDVGRLLRIQCKWASSDGAALLVRCFTARRSADGIVSRPYRHGEIDAFAAYAPSVERCYVLPFAWVGARRTVLLRVTHARNNQARGIHRAADFELESLQWLGYFEGP